MQEESSRYWSPSVLSGLAACSRETLALLLVLGAFWLTAISSGRAPRLSLPEGWASSPHQLSILWSCCSPFSALKWVCKIAVYILMLGYTRRIPEGRYESVYGSKNRDRGKTVPENVKGQERCRYCRYSHGTPNAKLYDDFWFISVYCFGMDECTGCLESTCTLCYSCPRKRMPLSSISHQQHQKLSTSALLWPEDIALVGQMYIWSLLWEECCQKKDARSQRRFKSLWKCGATMLTFYLFISDIYSNVIFLRISFWQFSDSRSEAMFQDWPFETRDLP